MDSMHPLEAAVARQMEQDCDAARMEIRHDRLREIMRQQVRCDGCGGWFHTQHMSTVPADVGTYTVCPACLWPEGN